LKSIFMFCDRPIIMSELNRLNKEHGDDFPIIQQEYFASHEGMMYSNQFPCVVKVGFAHAGMGKMRVKDHHDFEDFRSVMACIDDYVTAEPFLEGKYDLRIQKIGTDVKVFKRFSISGNWKTNTGSSHLEQIPVTEEYKRWAMLAGEMFGGLDICTVDALHDSKTGKESILEVNGTSSGLSPVTEKEDNILIRDLVLEKLNKLYGNIPLEVAI